MIDQEATNPKPAKQLLVLTDHECNTKATQVLQHEGYKVQLNDYLQFKVELLDKLQIDAILVDLENPTIESVSICQTIRDRYNGPLLFLTAPTNEFIQLLGLEMGADDFLFKPQTEVFLLTKLRARLKRAEKTQLGRKKIIRLGELQINSGRREVYCSGKNIHLTDREFDLLWLLAKNACQIISRDEIHRSLYKREYNGYDRSIDIYISRIRQKIGDNPHNPRHLKTIRGAGYLLVENHA